MLSFLALAPLALGLLSPGLPQSQSPTADGEFAKPMDLTRRPSPFVPGDLGMQPGGFFLRAHGESRFRFIEWESEDSLTRTLARLPKACLLYTSDAADE